MKLFSVLIFLSSFAYGQIHPLTSNNTLEAKDQIYFKNEAFMGFSTVERVDNNVRAINKAFGDIAELRAEIQALKKEILDLKKGK